MSYWVTIYRFAWGVLAIIAIIALICLFLPKVRYFHELQETRVEKRRQNAEKEGIIQTLRMKQEKFRNDSSFVEHTARGIGMVKPGETLFRFTNQPLATVEKPPSVTQ